METRKRLLTTLPSCHSGQFITVMFEKEGEMEGDREKQNTFAASIFLFLYLWKYTLSAERCGKMTNGRNKF